MLRIRSSGFRINQQNFMARFFEKVWERERERAKLDNSWLKPNCRACIIVRKLGTHLDTRGRIESCKNKKHSLARSLDDRNPPFERDWLSELRIGFLHPFHETLCSWSVSRKLWGNEIFLICLCNLTAGRKKKKKKTMTKKNYTLLIQEDDVLVTYEELALLLFLLTDVANFFDFMENTIVLFLGEDFLIDRTENFHLELAQEEEEEEEGIGSWWWWVAMSSLRRSGSFEVLRALDRARTQWYHFTTIIIAGMGFFTGTTTRTS